MASPSPVTVVRGGLKQTFHVLSNRCRSCEPRRKNGGSGRLRFKDPRGTSDCPLHSNWLNGRSRQSFPDLGGGDPLAGRYFHRDVLGRRRLVCFGRRNSALSRIGRRLSFALSAVGCLDSRQRTYVDLEPQCLRRRALTADPAST